MAIDFAKNSDALVVDTPTRYPIAKARSNFLQPSGNPVFFCWRNGAMVGPNTRIPYDIVNFNDGGGYDPATGLYTAPVEGVYHFKSFLSMSAVGEWRLIMVANGSAVRVAIGNLAAVMTHTIHLEAVLYLLKGQTVWVYYMGPTNAAPSTATNFSGHFVA